MNDFLFQPYQLGDISLENRAVMAPMTRRRADLPHLTANEMIALHYVQRSSTGLLITEGSQISPEGYGYTGSPGCYTPEQLEGWKKVTRAVHNHGGKIFLQLWHVGPFSHRTLQPNGLLPLSASPVKPQGEVLTPDGHKPYETAREMTQDEIYKTIADFGKAAKNAMEAGFDGVEIHGAHGYLIDQFIMDATNWRKDDFGGKVENRAKFLFLVIEEILKSAYSSKVGLRLSPKSARPEMRDSDAEKTFGYIVGKLNDYKLSYLHLSEFPSPEERLNHPENSFVPIFRKKYQGTLISCGSHTFESASRMLERNEADLIAFGKPLISNPDLIHRFKNGFPLTEPDKSTFYHGGATGYVDYPFYSAH